MPTSKPSPGKPKRKAGLSQRRVSKAEYLSLFEDAMVGISQALPNGRLIRANKTYARMYGYPSPARMIAEIRHVGRQLYANPEERKKVLRRLASKGVMEPREFQLIRRDGTPFTALVTARAVKKPNGKLLYYQATHVDITEQKRAEEALRRGDAQIKATLEAAADGILAVDDKGKVLNANRRFAQLWRIPRPLMESGDDQALLDHALGQLTDPEAFLKKVQRLYGSDAADADTLNFKDGRIFERVSFPLILGGAVVGRVWSFRDITDRKRAEEALAESKALLQSIMDSTDDLIWSIDSDRFRLLTYNKGLEVFFKEAGIRIREGMLLEEIVPKELADKLSELYSRALRKGSLATEYRTTIGDRALLINLRVLKRDKKPYAISVFAKDITARKEAEHALRDQEARYRGLFNRMSSGVVIYEAVDNGGDFVIGDFNPAAEKMEKVRGKDILGKRVSEVFPGVKTFGILKVFQRVWQTGKPERFPEHLYKDDRNPGSWRESWVFKMPSGEIVAIYNDISGRRRMEEALRASEDRYHAMFEQGGDGILLLDTKGKIISINETFARMHGFTVKELSHMGLEGLDVQGPESGAERLRRITAGETLTFDVEHYHKDGRIIPFTVTANLISAGRERLILAVHRDTSERKQAEESLRRSESNLRALALELARAEERERQRLALCLHDEIGQSLALVRLKLGGLAAASKSRSDKRGIGALRDLLETVIEQTHALVFDLSPPVLHQLGLAAAVEWAGEKIGRDYGLAFSFEDDGVAKSLSSDLQAILFRCVRELMLNAAKHANASLLTVALARDGDTTSFSVADDGIGFDATLRNLPMENKGYGLFSVREHLATMGGTCRIQSAPGQGTRVTLTVPASDGTPRESEGDGQKTLWPPARKDEPR